MVTVTTLKRPNLANMPTLILSISYWFNIKNLQDINSAITKKHLLKTAHVHLRRCNVSIQPWGWRSVILMTRKVTSFAHFMKSRTQLSFEVLESFSACYLLYVVTPCGPPTQLFGFTAGWEQWAHRLKHCWASDSYPSYLRYTCMMEGISVTPAIQIN